MLLRFVFFRSFLSILFLFIGSVSFTQLKWQNVDSLYQPLPPSVHVYFTNDKVDTNKFRAFYLIADLKDKNLDFTTDTTFKRRFTPTQFYEKNNHPLVVVNCTFFEFVHHSNLNLVVKNGRLIAQNKTTAALRGKDTLKYAHTFNSAIGITQKRNADVAWTFTDSSKNKPYASQLPHQAIIDSNEKFGLSNASSQTSIVGGHSGGVTPMLKKWKVKTAVGGGPVLVQNGAVKITNEEERKFYGKAINDKHPRTAMGYTKDNKFIILVVEGRNANAGGATLIQEAQILKDLGCEEALNLDGGGSSCLLINGKETIKPSDKSQRAVPAVFIIASNR
jgi:exopolysaccharide biosynthesis protein